MTRQAMISGCTGQDGYFLTKKLLLEGYEVIGLVRRTSLPTDLRLTKFMASPCLHLVDGDVTDLSSIMEIVGDFKPDLFFHLAAQSHVAKSWKYPVATTDVNTMGTLNCLEAIRKNSPATRFYFAGSSEMFGNTSDGTTKLNEQSPMMPESPYAVSKLSGYHMTRTYRRSYGMHASCGILFNHESVDISTSIIVRDKLGIDVIRIKDLLPDLTSDIDGGTFTTNDIELWDGEDWYPISRITVKKTDPFDIDNAVRTVNTRHGVMSPTGNHNMLDKDNRKVKASDLSVDDHLLHGVYPKAASTQHLDISEYEAYLLGYIAGDGWVDTKSKKFSISCLSEDRLNVLKDVWSHISDNQICIGQIIESEFGHSRRLGFCDAKFYSKFDLRNSFYNSDKKKRVPRYILNVSKDVQLAFLRGYNAADGLKANKCTYEFKNFKTNSSHLAQGLLFLIANTTGQDWNVTYEDSKGTGEYYYSINLLSPNPRIDPAKYGVVSTALNLGTSQRQIARDTRYSRSFIRKIQNGEVACLEHPLTKPKNAIKKIVYEPHHEFVADICVESGKFMAGVGTMVIANSPLRGEEFVTRKITTSLARIKHGLQDKVKLGNIKSMRDWGHARDYVRAMHLMLEQDEPGDYVIATGATYSVEHFVMAACDHFGLKPSRVIEIDPSLIRPKDVKILIGDAYLAKKKLGWEPETKFMDLVKEMCEHDYMYCHPDPEKRAMADQFV